MKRFPTTLFIICATLALTFTLTGCTKADASPEPKPEPQLKTKVGPGLEVTPKGDNTGWIIRAGHPDGENWKSQFMSMELHFYWGDPVMENGKYLSGELTMGCGGSVQNSTCLFKNGKGGGTVTLPNKPSNRAPFIRIKNLNDHPIVVYVDSITHGVGFVTAFEVENGKLINAAPHPLSRGGRSYKLEPDDSQVVIISN